MALLPLIIIPAFQAEGRIRAVLTELRSIADALELKLCLLVVDDGSTDNTLAEARACDATVLRHPENLGKGAAIQTGLRFAEANGFDDAITADADGQHPAAEIVRMAQLSPASNTLVLGIRNLKRDGAPFANQCSNAISNYFLSRFIGHMLQDTQCGLRRYPVAQTLALNCRDSGYAFEAEVLLRAARRGMHFLQLPIQVIYPQATERITHFHVVRDPYRIIVRVLKTLSETE